VHIETFTGPAAASARVRESAFDGVVSDHRMPGMNGIAFLLQVRAPDAPDSAVCARRTRAHNGPMARPNCTPRVDAGRRALGALALALFGLGAGVAASPGVKAEPVTASAAELHAQRAALQPQLRASSFGEPLVLSSREEPDRLEGDVYAEMARPFAAVASAVRTPAGICEVLVLHLNVHGCVPSVGATGEGVSVFIGPKRAAPSGSGMHRMDYVVRAEVAEADHLRVTLSADSGPMSTRDYRIVFEVVPIDAGRSFVHCRYAYRFGAVARMAMGAYLATLGRSKIGFTVEGTDAEGRPTFVKGERAALERNIMRYYLALQAHRSVTTGALEEQLLARQRTWFGLTERYAPQLHEYELADYLKEKRDDLARGTPTP